MVALAELRQVLKDPAIVCASIAASVLALVLPLSIIQVYDRVIPQSGHATLIALCAIVGTAILLEFGLRLARNLLLARAGAKFELRANAQAIDALLSEDPARITPQSQGEILTGIGAADRLRAIYTGPTSGTHLDVLIAIFFLAFLFAISPAIALVLLVIVAGAYALTRRLRRRVRRLHQDRISNEARRQSFLTEVLGTIDTVRALHIEPQMQRRYDRLIAHSSEITDEFVAAVEASKSFTATVGMSAPLLVTAFGASLYLQGHLTLGLLAATIILTGRIIQPILQFESYLAGSDSARDAARDFRDLVERPRIRSGPHNLFVVDEMRLEGVTTVEDEATGIAFTAVNAVFRQGTCTQIIAPTPHHGSLFLRLLAGEIVIEEGRMLINERPFEEYDARDRRSAIRSLGARNRLLEGTLIENISNFGGSEARAEAFDLAREIGLDRHIAPTVEGYDIRLSHGEQGPLPRSLVEAAGLISALNSDPSLILLDEPNACLDMDTDKRFTEMIAARRESATIVMLTQRPSLAKLCDRTLDIGPHCTNRGRAYDAQAATSTILEGSHPAPEQAP